MKSIKTFVAVIALSAVSFTSFAQSVSASGSQLDTAEAQIAAKAQEAGAASYKITSASTGNYVYMTADLIK
ncbi:YdgH/BhsA/McbA-like domain containing protein [Pantoea sp. B65]|uniref:YdgH/BhsA/McbA-like domain containing protein n=1 Tax=Pantoea sp. B65 TaxID=2813359 RepID=UPI0039B6C996